GRAPRGLPQDGGPSRLCRRELQRRRVEGHRRLRQRARREEPRPHRDPGEGVHARAAHPPAELGGGRQGRERPEDLGSRCDGRREAPLSSMRFLPLVVLLSSAAAAAATPLDPYDAQSFTVGMPRGWRITSDASRGIVVAEEDPGRKDAAALVLMTSSNAIQSADALLDAVAAHVAGDLKVLRREAIPGGGSLMVA